MTKRIFNLGKIRKGLLDFNICDPAFEWLHHVRASSEDALFEACLRKWRGVEWIGWLCNMLNAPWHPEQNKMMSELFSPRVVERLNQMYERFSNDEQIDWMWEHRHIEIEYATLQSRRKRAMRIMREIWYDEPITCPKCGKKSWPSEC